MRRVAAALVLMLAGCEAGADTGTATTATAAASATGAAPATGAALATGAAPAATPGTAAPRLFGAPLTATSPEVPLTQILTTPDRFVGQVVRTEGEVTSVCQAMGCWMEMRAGEGQPPVHVPMVGHSFFLPKDVTGRRARIEGRVHMRERSPGEVRHLAGEGAQALASNLGIDALGVEIR